jgi:hypothetical protein
MHRKQAGADPKSDRDEPQEDDQTPETPPTEPPPVPVEDPPPDDQREGPYVVTRVAEEDYSGRIA